MTRETRTPEALDDFTRAIPRALEYPPPERGGNPVATMIIMLAVVFTFFAGMFLVKVAQNLAHDALLHSEGALEWGRGMTDAPNCADLARPRVKPLVWDDYNEAVAAAQADCERLVLEDTP